MIHNHHHHQMHQMQQINVSQPPPPPQQNLPQQSNSQRMNHHHYQQRLNHQQIQQQQQLPPQIHGSRGNGGGGGGINNQHQIPPPIIQKQHLHQNIATLNQKPPPQHVNSQSSQNSQIQPTVTVAQRMSYEKTNNLKRESSSISVPHSATATLPANNNSSIVTGPTSSIAAVPTSLSHHHHHQQQHHHHHLNNSNNNSNLLPKYHQHHQVIDITKTSDIKSTPVVSANKENIPLNVSGGSNSQPQQHQQSHNSNNNNINNNINSSILSNNSHSEVISAESTEQGIESLANAKEKTPMCLVNELARFNKIQHQYRLVSEQGPAHKKRFTVILKLGEEEYAAEGLSIKKAQHAAAKDAIMKTSYKHPPLKINRQLKGLQSVNAKGNTGNITPTVELNALAMKRGEPTVYTFINTTTNPSIAPNSMPFGQQQLPPPSQYNGRGNPYQRRPYQRGGLSNSRYNYNGTEIFHVALQVGNRTFAGMGPTQQAARHDAAARALEVLKPLTLESESQKVISNEEEGEDVDDSLINSDIKSPISIVHEMALKRKLTVSFEVQSEKGPPHMKVYTTLCKVGTIVTEGEGNGKKLSKKKAAEKMMEELKKLPPASPVEEPSNHRGNMKGRRKQQQQQQQQQQQPVVKKKTRNLIKEKLEQSAGADEINPISQLIQIQQARKEKEPTYNVIDERGTARRREFVIEVVVNGYSATGTGPNKKIAKRIAAENLLIAMGIGKPASTTNTTSQVDTPVTKEKKAATTDSAEKSKKVSFNDADTKKSAKSHGSGGRQIVPGLLLVSSNETFSTPAKAATTTTTAASTPPKDDSNNNNNNSNNQSIEKSSSPNSNASNNDSGIGENGVSPRDQLNYLAQLIGFSVSYSDFPKANHTEFLSLVTLSTDPPHMGHGSGTTIEESRDSAALKALSVISDIGIDNVKPKGSK